MSTIAEKMTVYFEIDTEALEKSITLAISKALKEIEGFSFSMSPLEALIALFDRGLKQNEAAEKTTRFAESLGITSQECYAFLKIATDAGIEVNRFLEDAIQLKQKAEQALTDPKIEGHFKKIGVAVKNAEGNARPFAGIYKDYLISTQKLRNVKPEKRNSEFAPFRALGQNDDTTKNYANEKLTAEKVDELIQKAPHSVNKSQKFDSLNDALNKLKYAFTTFDESMSDVTRNIFIGLSDGVEKFVLWISEHQEFIYGFFAGLITWIIALGVAAMANPAGLIATGIALAITVLVAVIKDLFSFLDGKDSVLSDFWSAVGDGNDALEEFKLAWLQLKTIIFPIFEGIKIGIAIVMNALSNLLALFINTNKVIMSVVEVIFKFVKGDQFGAQDSLKKVKKYTLAQGRSIANIFTKPYEKFIADKFENDKKSDFSTPAPSSLDAFPAAARGSMYNSSSQNSVTTGDIIVNANTSDPQALGGAVAARIQKYDTYLQDKTRANANYGFAG